MHEIGERKYISNKGTPYEITPKGGLYSITMKRGGKPPPFCFQLYTSYGKAEQILEDYLRKTDRRGYAVYPSKERNA